MEITDLTKHFNLTMPMHDNSGARSYGIHVSNVIQLMKRDGLKEWKEYQSLPPEARDAGFMRMEQGFVWEELLSLVWKERMAVRPMEVELDGIYGSPDGIWTPAQLATYGLKFSTDVLLEMKWTSRSTKTDFENWFSCITQCKAYCKMLGISNAIVIACHNKGDYSWLKFDKDEAGNPLSKPISFPAPMELRATLVQFSEEELNLNWNNMAEVANANFDTLIKMGNINITEE